MKYWQWLSVFASALAWAVLGYVVGPSWLGMICAALVGYFVGAALWMAQSARWRSLAEEALFHLHGESSPLESPDEHKPRLH